MTRGARRGAGTAAALLLLAWGLPHAPAWAQERPRPSPRPTETARPTPKPTPKPTAKPTATPAASPRATARPAATAARLSPSPSPTARPAATRRPRATPRPTATPRATPAPAAKATPVPPRTIPYDPYALREYLAARYDALWLLPRPEEAIRYRVESARGKAVELNRLVGRFAELVDQRQANIRRAAATAYVLGRARRTPVYMGPQVSSLHLLMVRSTIRADADELERRLPAYTSLREELNAAVDRADRMEEEARTGDLAALPESDLPQPPRGAVTEWRPAAVERANRALLEERAFNTRVLLAVLEMEQMARESRGRATLQSFAPPPPGEVPFLDPFVSPDTPMPTETGPGRRQPAAPRLTPPAARGLTLKAAAGAPVRAGRDGTVGYAGPFRGYGNMVILEHPGGLFSIHAHLGGVTAEPGRKVRAGDQIGSASDAPDASVYFEVRRDDEVVEPSVLLKGADPAAVLLGR